MKKLIATGIAALLVSGLALAQIPPATAYLKSHMDSLRTMGWFKGDTSTPGQVVEPGAGLYGRPRSFEELNDNAVLLTVTPRGKVYALSPDNMPVLVPDMTLTEKMPGSSRSYRPAPPSKMPNPLYPRQRKRARTG
jgi:hypothetical protein